MLTILSTLSFGVVTFKIPSNLSQAAFNSAKPAWTFSGVSYFSIIAWALTLLIVFPSASNFSLWAISTYPKMNTNVLVAPGANVISL